MSRETAPPIKLEDNMYGSLMYGQYADTSSKYVLASFDESVTSQDSNYFESSVLAALQFGESMFGGNPVYVNLFYKETIKNLIEPLSVTEIYNRTIKITAKLLDLLNFSEVICRIINRSKTDVVSVSDSRFKNITRNIADAFASSEIFIRGKVISELLEVSDSIIKNIYKNVSDLFNSFDIILKPVFANLHDEINSEDFIIKKIFRSVRDVFASSDDIIKSILKIFSDSIYENDRGEDYPYLGGNYFGSLTYGGDIPFSPLYFKATYIPFQRPYYKSNDLVVSVRDNSLSVLAKNGIISVRAEGVKVIAGTKNIVLNVNMKEDRISGGIK